MQVDKIVEKIDNILMKFETNLLISRQETLNLILLEISDLCKIQNEELEKILNESEGWKNGL